MYDEIHRAMGMGNVFPDTIFCEQHTLVVENMNMRSLHFGLPLPEALERHTP